MKKFLLVATVVKGHVNAFHIPVLKMMKELGYEVHVIARNDFKIVEDCIIPFCDKYYDMPFEREPFKKNNVKSLFKLKEIIDKENYEIIHCHTPVGGALTRIAAKKSRRNGTYVLYTAHGFHFYNKAPILNWAIFYPIEKILSKYTDTIITINSEDYKNAQKMHSRNVFKVNGVGINLKNFNKTINFNNKRQSLGINKEDFVLVSVGELNKNKNHKIIIEALANFKNKKLKYFICGEGPLLSDLKKLVEKLNLSDKVIFLGYRSDINEILQISNLFVFPSIREGLSLSLMEAMASGLPCLVSEIRGNKDLIENNKGGFTFRLGDKKDLEQKMELIINNQNNLKNFSNYNLKKIKKYGEENVLNQIKSIYELYR